MDTWQLVSSSVTEQFLHTEHDFLASPLLLQSKQPLKSGSWESEYPQEQHFGSQLSCNGAKTYKSHVGVGGNCLI